MVRERLRKVLVSRNSILAPKGGEGHQESVKSSEIQHLSKVVLENDQRQSNTRQKNSSWQFNKTNSHGRFIYFIFSFGVKAIR